MRARKPSCQKSHILLQNMVFKKVGNDEIGSLCPRRVRWTDSPESCANTVDAHVRLADVVSDGVEIKVQGASFRNGQSLLEVRNALILEHFKLAEEGREVKYNTRSDQIH